VEDLDTAAAEPKSLGGVADFEERHVTSRQDYFRSS
jgi:hypothetical protein